MKNFMILLFVIILSNNLLIGQEGKDTLNVNYIYPPQLYENLSAEESWEIHKAAYVKKMKIQGLTDDEIKKSLEDYEKQKEEYIAEVKEKLKLTAILREKEEEQRKQAEIQRKQADELRKQAEIQRKKADELRKQAEIKRKKADAQRAKSAIGRERASELRKQAEIQRKKAEEHRKLAEIKRAKAEEQRKKAQEWRKNAKNILTKNVTLSKQSNKIEPILFNVSSKTTLRIGIRAHISSGITLIEIYNPKGIKEGELSLTFDPKPNSNDEDEESKFTSGSIDTTIVGAEAGEWQIRISPQESEGTVAMSVAQDKK